MRAATAAGAENCDFHGEPPVLWYLLAHDTEKDDWRLFRLDRITHPLPTGRRVPPRPVPGGDPAAFVADRLSAAPPPPRRRHRPRPRRPHPRPHPRPGHPPSPRREEHLPRRRLRRLPAPHRPDPGRPRHRLHPSTPTRTSSPTSATPRAAPCVPQAEGYVLDGRPSADALAPERRPRLPSHVRYRSVHAGQRLFQGSGGSVVP
ncbi:WYL domain-containing protein [Streptomyces triculaminicus]|uniref:WYL domain-containing protein n=1 Tax=Streptomyces triculaminicus TaxID=2816232 RepID=UPI003557DD74